ncbi:hypothetical protein COHA_002857 [Chlorella ohadii]|uniref:EXPERA domain-containing protein n=1 Tax=Chlorella ohadii TaxID=2649997 RepID=A0AAD5DSP7_9CHLO|nr:hypothetical protein COHA_002857 [Chlorella ohadii]
MNNFLYFIYLGFFLSHIPITLFVDSQAVLPASWFPSVCRKMMAWYFETHRDPLMMHLPVWFKTLVYSEIYLQLPFFFVATYAFVGKKNWIRIPAIFYGAFVTSTMLPILAELAVHTGPGYRPAIVTSFYAPYLLVPLCLALHMMVTPQPFGSSRSSKSKRH